MGNKFLQYFSLTLTVIGAINWGLIGFFNLNLVALLFGSMSLLSRIIYGLVGLCGLYLLSFYGLVEQDRTSSWSACFQGYLHHISKRLLSRQ